MDAALWELLRVHPEPYEFLDDAEVHRRLTHTPAAYLDHVDAGLENIAGGRWQVEQPAKRVFRDPGMERDFRVMPCVVRRPGGACKTVKLVGTNTGGRRVPEQITVGRAFALDAAENFVRAGFAACLLSSARTGACAAIARRRLAAPCERLLVVGCGRVGYYSAFYIGGEARPAAIHCLDRDPERAARTAAALARQLPGVHCEAVTHAVPCDVMVMATDSRTPLLGAEDPLPATVISLGADSAWQHEVDGALACHYRLYVDTLDSLACGDLLAWQAEGLMDDHEVTDLLSLVRTGPPAPGPALFVSTGSALLDNLTIDYLLARDSQRPVP